jgi:hypothetical protein
MEPVQYFIEFLISIVAQAIEIKLLMFLDQHVGPGLEEIYE